MFTNSEKVHQFGKKFVDFSKKVHWFWGKKFKDLQSRNSGKEINRKIKRDFFWDKK